LTSRPAAPLVQPYCSFPTSLFLCFHLDHRDLHSFPTRRSSDLDNQPFNENMLRPCPMLENPEKLRAMVAKTNAHSTDLQSPESVDRKSTRLNSSHVSISYAVFCLKKKKKFKERTYATRHKNSRD